VRPPVDRDDWLALASEPLPVGAAHDWAVRPACGAVVLFTGTVRDHADGRPGVSELEYEAYESQVVPKLADIAGALRARWPMLGRVALLHRVGPLALGDVSVVVAVSAPHRPEAFDAARYGIDTLKATVPIWKRETWAGGVDWGTCAHDVEPVERVEAVDPRR
jgi:molybdopterin synthase catalytic subunit